MNLILKFNDIATLCIPIVAGILGVALPIIVQTIGQIDIRYNSIRLVKRFKKEPVYRLFMGSLIFAIVLLIYNNFVALPWPYDWGSTMNFVMSRSSDIFVLLATVVLIFYLFFVVRLIICYYDYQDLFRNIRKRIKVKTNINENDARDLVELGKFVLLKDDNETSSNIYQFLDDYAHEKTKNADSNAIEFDNWFYDAILTLNETLCRENIRPLSIVNENDILKILIPEYNPKSIISDKTYTVLWRALQQQIFYDKTDWIVEYWRSAHQFIWLRLKPIEKDIDYSTDPYTVKNEDEVKIRDRQIARFKEFHIVLGGLFLYLGKYDILREVTSLSSSQPYQFPLVPSSFQEITYQFTILNTFDSSNPFYFERFYSFPGVRGIDTGNISLGWANRYLLLLLFRLNSAEVENMARWKSQWELPFIPESLNETTTLLRLLEQMKNFAQQWVTPGNLKIIDTLNWQPKEGNPQPLEKINEFITKLEESVIKQRENLDLSNDKIQQFNDRSKKIIRGTVYSYEEILQTCSQDSETDRVKDVINSSYSMPLDKEAFSDDQTKTFLNFDEVVAISIVHEFYRQYSFSYYQHGKRSHTINSEQLFDALDKLIGEKRENYVVVAFGLYLDYYLDGPRKQPELKKIKGDGRDYAQYSYKGTLKIHNIPSGDSSIMEQSLAIINVEDLPCYINRIPPEEMIKKYDLKPIENSIQLYSSVLKDNFPEENKNIDTSKHCLATIYYCLLLYWKENADVTILRLVSRYLDSGKGEEIPTLSQLGGREERDFP